MVLKVLEPTPIGERALRIVSETTHFLLGWIIPGLSRDDVEVLLLKEEEQQRLPEEEREDIMKKYEEIRRKVDSSPNFTVIVGSRGIGKTTLLRAIEFIHQKVGKNVIYIAADILSHEAGKNEVLNKLKEKINVAKEDNTTIVIDDFPEFVYLFKGKFDELADLFDDLLKNLIRTEIAKTKVLLAVQSELDLLQPFIVFWTDHLESKPTILTIFEQRRLPYLIHSWYILAKKEDLEREGLLYEYKLRTRRGLFIDLDAVWYYLKRNQGKAHQVIEGFIRAVNNGNLSLSQEEFTKLVECIKFYWTSSVAEEEDLRVLTAETAIKKIIEHGGGSKLREIYNDIVSKGIDVAYSKVQDIESKLAEPGSVSLLDIDISTFVEEVSSRLMKIGSPELTSFQVLKSYRIRVESEKVKSGTRKIDIVLTYRAKPICLFIAVTAKPRYTGSKGGRKQGVSVSIPQRVKDIIENLDKIKAYTIFFVYNEDVAERIRNLAESKGIPPIDFDLKSSELISPPAYGIVKLSDLDDTKLKLAKMLVEKKLDDKLAETVIYSLRVEKLDYSLVHTIRLIRGKVVYET